MKQLFCFSQILMLSMLSLACNTNELAAYRGNHDVNESAERQDPQGDVTTTNYPLRDFSAITVGGIAEVIYTQGMEYAVRVEESPQLKTIARKEGNTLVIGNEPKKKQSHSFNGRVTLKVYVSAPQLSGINLSGATKFSTKKLETGNLNVNISGASKISLQQVVCHRFRLDASGATKWEGQVNAKESDIEISGASKVVASIQGGNVRVQNSGASNVQLQVDCEQLRASNSGAGKLKISGTADEVKIYGSGVAKVDTSKLNQF